jgi:hypothetical protein
MKPVWKRISSIAEVEQFISQEAAHDRQLLVVFDMDLTLTMPRLPAFIYLTVPSYRDKLQRLLAPLSEADKRKVLTLGLQVSGHRLVEQAAPSIIRGIQARCIKTIVLTASLTGQANDEIPIELQRFQKLCELGIVLEGSYPQQKIILDDLPTYNTNFPVYYRGVLCANGAPGTNIKGPVLVSFLQHTNYKPQSIIMVDDKIDHLNDVYQSLVELDPHIHFIGLEYVGAQAYIPQQISEDAFIVYWQSLIDQVLNKN